MISLMSVRSVLYVSADAIASFSRVVRSDDKLSSLLLAPSSCWYMGVTSPQNSKHGICHAPKNKLCVLRRSFSPKFVLYDDT